MIISTCWVGRICFLIDRTHCEANILRLTKVFYLSIIYSAEKQIQAQLTKKGS